jgi:hypothetical protein
MDDDGILEVARTAKLMLQGWLHPSHLMTKPWNRWRLRCRSSRSADAWSATDTPPVRLNTYGVV